MTIRLVAGILWLMVVCVSVFGCGTTDPGAHGNPGPLRVEELENGLRFEPSFEVARAEYSAAMDQMAGKIAAVVPGMSWHVEESSWNGCSGAVLTARSDWLMPETDVPTPIPTTHP